MPGLWQALSLECFGREEVEGSCSSGVDELILWDLSPDRNSDLTRLWICLLSHESCNFKLQLSWFKITEDLSPDEFPPSIEGRRSVRLQELL